MNQLRNHRQHQIIPVIKMAMAIIHQMIQIHQLIQRQTTRVLNAAGHVRSAISLEHSNVVWAVQRAVPNHWNAKGLYQSMLIIQLVRNNFHLFFTLCEGEKSNLYFQYDIRHIPSLNYLHMTPQYFVVLYLFGLY